MILENEKLRVSAKAEGAELTSIYDKTLQRECLWTADPAYWASHAPVLFPVVGRCQGNRYRYRGQEYELGQHGFAKISVFEVEESTSNRLVFVLRDTEETRKAYPFAFCLRVIYELEDDQVTVRYEVENPSESEPMYFSIGGHPGFLFEGPLEKQIFTFSEKENMDRLLLADIGQFSRRVEKDYVKDGESIAITPTLFEHDALVFYGFRSEEIGLINKESGHGVIMNIKGFPYVGLWSKPGAPYACIEPWYGLADYEDFFGELPEKDGIESLEAGKTFVCSYRMKFV